MRDHSKRRINKRLIEQLTPQSHDYTTWDNTLPGFGIRVRSSGAMAYVYVYRAGKGRGAPLRRYTIGNVHQITPEQARDKAKQLLGAVAEGHDPAKQDADDRASLLVSELADLFMSDHVAVKRKARTAEHYRDVIDRIIKPRLGKTKANKLTRADVAKLHIDLKDTPYQANRVLAIVGSMYGFGDRVGVVPEGFNPARRIEKFKENRRERFLTVEELQRLGAALHEAETVGIPWRIDVDKPNSKHVPKENRRTIISLHAAAAIRLLMFTGARLREILHLKWEHVDLQRGLLLLPDSKTGRKTIVLNAPARAVISQLPRIGIYVIAGDSAGSKEEKPRSDLHRPWHTLTQYVGLEGVRIHDLRHTHASVGAGAGLGLPIIGKLLGHNQASTTQRYAHLDADPLRRASEHIGAEIARAMGEATEKRHPEITLLPVGLKPVA